MQPLIIIIISNFNGASITYNAQSILKACLDSVPTADYPNCKILLADDCSPDNSVEYVRNNYPPVEIIKTARVSGFSINNNNAIRFAKQKYDPAYILLLNNDIILTEKNCLNAVVQCAVSDKATGIIGIKLLYPEGRVQHAGIITGIAARNRGRAESDRGQYNAIEEVSAVTGAFFLMSREVINRVGLFDEILYMGMEDVDYCLRVKEAGFKVVYNGTVSAVHLEGVSSTNSTRRELSDERFRMNQTGNIYFAFKHFKNPFWIILVVLCDLANALLTIEDKNRVRKLINLRFKKRLLWRIAITFKAILLGYRIFKENSQKPFA